LFAFSPRLDATVNQPTPAIVAQGAVRQLPRFALLLLCLAYAVPGLVGRAPWKSADMASFGYMLEMARGNTLWTDPMLLGLRPEADGLLPYWVGAWAVQVFGGWLGPALAARLPFVVMLGLAMAATWYAVYFLARKPQAQPVAFAFGGQANPTDYARAIADGGLLALIASLGLAQLAHEITTSLAQLCFTALAFYAVAAMGHRRWTPAIGIVAGLSGLALSGAPTLAVLFGLGSLVLHGLAPASEAQEPKWKALTLIAIATLAAAALASSLDLWRWRVLLPQDAGSKDWRTLARLLLWFTWPAWPLVLWTVWRWRLQIFSRSVNLHLALPLWFALVTLTATLTTKPADRALLLSLPALATLAAFALPTLQRSVAALIDWFTLLFFTGCGAVIWVIWIAMQTGFPRQAAANALRQAPGFEASFSATEFLIALGATLVWAGLVHWRVGRHRAALWKSMVLPAGGAALCWLLLMTLWMPLLDFVRSYTVVVRNVSTFVGTPACIQEMGLSREQIAAFQYHGGFRILSNPFQARCEWLLVNPDPRTDLPAKVNTDQWQLAATIRRPSDKGDDVVLFQRVTP
jgi:4-amino-4-deoxy-L-arabinose transferase-like glycosyltransferase